MRLTRIATALLLFVSLTLAAVGLATAVHDNHEVTILKESMHARVSGRTVSLQQVADALSTFATQLGQVRAQVALQGTGSSFDVSQLQTTVTCLKEAVQALQNGGLARIGCY